MLTVFCHFVFCFIYLCLCLWKHDALKYRTYVVATVLAEK
jgi:hypothetical protein